MLREALVSMGNDVHLLDKWYRKDTNKVSKGLSKSEGLLTPAPRNERFWVEVFVSIVANALYFVI